MIKQESTPKRVVKTQKLSVSLPFGQTITLPPVDSLAFYATVAALGIAGLVEWPIAALVSAGHLLASQHNNKIAEEVGEALENA